MMFDKQRDKARSKREPKAALRPEETESEKKTPDTVHLSAEELRSISGGATGPTFGPKPKVESTTKEA